MSLSFRIDPTRRVTGPDGEEWTVLLRRGSTWPGWRWLDWLADHIEPADPGGATVILALGALAVPSILLRKVLYRLAGWTDWTVSCYRGPADYQPRQAVLFEVCSNRDEGVALAESLSERLRGGWHPKKG